MTIAVVGFSEAYVQNSLNVVFRSLHSAYIGAYFKWFSEAYIQRNIGDYCKWFSEAYIQNNLNVVFRESDVGGFT